MTLLRKYLVLPEKPELGLPYTGAKAIASSPLARGDRWQGRHYGETGSEILSHPNLPSRSKPHHCAFPRSQSAYEAQPYHQSVDRDYPWPLEPLVNLSINVN